MSPERIIQVDELTDLITPTTPSGVISTIDSPVFYPTNQSAIDQSRTLITRIQSAFNTSAGTSQPQDTSVQIPPTHVAINRTTSLVLI